MGCKAEEVSLQIKEQTQQVPRQVLWQDSQQVSKQVSQQVSLKVSRQFASEEMRRSEETPKALKPPREEKRVPSTFALPVASSRKGKTWREKSKEVIVQVTNAVEEEEDDNNDGKSYPYHHSADDSRLIFN